MEGHNLKTMNDKMEKEMKLYHFTTQENALLVALGGLQPKVRNDHVFQTFGTPVVWLTREESNLATAEHVAHFAKINRADLINTVGAPLYSSSNPVRCEVELSRHNKKLMRWIDFLRTTDLAAGDPLNGEIAATGSDIVHIVQHSIAQTCREKWWIYMGDIPVRKMFVPLSAATALHGVDYQIEHNEDAEAVAQSWRPLREQLAALDPTDLVQFSETEKDGDAYRMQVYKTQPAA
jgi:hypothetical protein